MLPGVEPAMTVIEACPLLPVAAAAALRVALPLVTANATLTPATGLLLAFTAWTTNGIEKAVLTVAVCPPPETALSAVSGTLTVRLKVAETVPAATVTVTGPAVLPRVARADARPLLSVAVLTLLNVAPAPGETTNETAVLGIGFPPASVT